MAFKNVRNLLLINHNDGFIDDDEFVVLYDLYAAKNLDFPYAPFDLEKLDEPESFAEFRFGKREIPAVNWSTLFSRSRISSSKVLSSVGSGTSIPDAFSSSLCFSLCREIRSANRSLTTLAVTLNSGLFREFK